MLRLLPISTVILVLLGCSSGPETVDMLPTATIEPTPVTPTATATFLPPPTVTPFPTATPRSEAVPPAEGETEGGEEAAQPTAPPPPAAAGPLPTGVNAVAQVLEVDFERGWPSENSETAKYTLNDGVYIFEIGPFDGRFISSDQVSESDYYTQVDVIPAQCPAEAGYGLFFRYTDVNNYYAITVFCDGRYRFVTRVDGGLTGGENGQISGVDVENGPVTLGVLADGAEITFYLNGEVVATFTDDQLISGDVALYVVSTSGDKIQVAFDNLGVWTVN